MKCRKCENEFTPKHFNQKLCSAECKRAVRRDVLVAYKKSEKGIAAEMRWRANPAKKEIDKRYMQTPNGRKLAVIRATRNLKNNPNLLEKKRIRDIEYQRSEKGREVNRECAKRYGKTDKGIASRKNGKARRRQREKSGNVTHAEWLAKLEEYNSCCAFCGSTERIEQDHIIPLSRGGKHEIGNIRPLCRKCNASKNSKLDSELNVNIVRTKSNILNPT